MANSMTRIRATMKPHHRIQIQRRILTQTQTRFLTQILTRIRMVTPKGMAMSMGMGRLTLMATQMVMGIRTPRVARIPTRMLTVTATPLRYRMGLASMSASTSA